MTYTNENLREDLAKISKFAAPARPDDVFAKVQWEMARTHQCLIEYWLSVEKQFDTSAPVDDAENYFGFALQWVRIIELHHQLEEEVQFPCWDAHIHPAMVKNHDEHVELMKGLIPFKAYLNDVASGAKTWSGAEARTLAQGFLPTLMHHFVEELYPLDAELLKSSGFTVEELIAGMKGVAAKGREIMDPARDIAPMITHNGGALDWPPMPWPMTAEYKMPAELYTTHKGWWKYSAIVLDI